MLHSRREGMAATACHATLAGIGITSVNAAPTRAPHGEIDCEVRLQISDGFTRQTWNQAGQVWTETRDILAFHEDEVVRVSIFNDTPAVRVISLGEGRPLLRIKPGEAESIDLTVDSLATFEIAVVGQPPFSRAVKVRPTDSDYAS